VICPPRSGGLSSPQEPALGEAYDSDTELSLEPGYAECADAIKGMSHENVVQNYALKMLCLYLDTVIISQNICNMLSILT